MTLYEINAQFAEAIELYENGVDEVVDTETGFPSPYGDFCF